MESIFNSPFSLCNKKHKCHFGLQWPSLYPWPLYNLFEGKLALCFHLTFSIQATWLWSPWLSWGNWKPLQMFKYNLETPSQMRLLMCRSLVVDLNKQCHWAHWIVLKRAGDGASSFQHCLFLAAVVWRHRARRCSVAQLFLEPLTDGEPHACGDLLPSETY